MNSAKRCSVKLLQGKLTGVEESLPNGKYQKVFRGIPYAVPPVGKLRFKPPVPLTILPELDCSVERDVCIQNDMITTKVVGSENCLYLNIFSPKLENKDAKLPVMLFFHGGGFATGSGDSSMYSPDYLVQENVVVVTCNYRLGPFGFLLLPRAGITGNAALYDQLLVLKWINEHIAKFNGDPNNVTLFGESAGAVATNIHFTSPLSRKYFHKAICQSGTVAQDWAIPINIQQKSRKLAALLGCTSTDDKDILVFLENVESDKILEKAKLTNTEDEHYRGLPFPFKPTYEQQGIYSKYQSKEMRNLDNSKIPIMIGYNSHEGIILMQNIMKKFKSFTTDLQRTIPLSVNVTIDSSSSVKIAEQIKQFYCGDKEITSKELVDILGDTQFINGIKITIENLKRLQKDAPIFGYRFSYDGELNMFKNMFGVEDINGACHADDLFYLFKSTVLDTEIEETSEAYQMRNIMCKLWTNFAKYGNPTPDDDETISFKWSPMNNRLPETENAYLDIGKEIKMVTNPDGERYKFWKSVYERWNGSVFKPKL